MNRYKPVGWRGEPHRHYLAAKGVSTKWKGKNKGLRGYFQDKEDGPFTIRGDLGGGEFVYRIRPGQATERLPEDVVKDIATPRTVTAQRFGTTGQPTGQAELNRVRARGRLTEELAQRERESRPTSKAIREIESGLFDNALDMLEEGGIRRDEARAIRTALGAQAIQQAQAGLQVPDAVFGELEPAQARRVQRTLAAAEDREAELSRGAIAQRAVDLGEEVKGAVAEGVLVGPGEEFTEGLRQLGSAAAGSGAGLGKNGLLNRIDNEKERSPGGVDSDLADNPMIESNAFIGNEEQQNPLSSSFDNIPSLNNNFDFLEADGQPPMNPVFQDTQKRKTQAEVVSEQVDELYKSRKNLAEVDLSGFEKGNEAFEKGDREGLISAINDLKAEETTLQDRFTLVEQARQNVKSVPNFSGAFKKRSGNAVFEGGLFSSGARKLSDQTDRINEVRQEIVDANEKAFARRRMLENRLKRLDSTVPPETSVPQKVDRFSKEEQGFTKLFGSNPLMGDKA